METGFLSDVVLDGALEDAPLPEGGLPPWDGALTGREEVELSSYSDVSERVFLLIMGWLTMHRLLGGMAVTAG